MENFKLDNNNIEFNKAVEFVKDTDKLIFLTGKAGTGKTTFLKYITSIIDRNTVVVAPTGVAAINAGGVTIHSFFQIPFGPFVPNDSRLQTKTTTDNKATIYTTFKYKKEKREIITNMEVLIIDEVSMVRADLLDVIDKILRAFRKKPLLPFGGVQVILIGDAFQLPPIADDEQWKILSEFYKTPFFFSSKVIECNKPVYIELKKIYRQNEIEFIDLLNRVRVNQLTEQDFRTLNAKYNPDFSDNGEDYIILATHNKIVNETNLSKLNKLDKTLFTYDANVTGIFPNGHKPTEDHLQLKIGAQVMFIKNDIGLNKRYYNGKIGKIKHLDKSSIIVIFDDESKVEVERTTWENVKYTYDKKRKKIIDEVIGTFEQFPIRLAWAISVHKSQGLTFNKVIADLSRAFAPGQVYVALSRCTSLNGLVLKTQLNSNAIKTAPAVLEFAKNETPDTLITEQLNTGKADYYYKKARENFYQSNITNAFSFLKKALKFRNDINTDVFRRFIEVQANKLFDFKREHSSLQKDIEIVNNELLQERENIIQLSQELSAKSEIIEDYQISFLRHVENILKLEKKNEKLSEKNEEQEKYISNLENKSSEQQSTIATLEIYNDNHKDTIDLLNDEKTKLEEICRILVKEKEHLVNKQAELKKIKQNKNSEISDLKSEIVDMYKKLSASNDYIIEITKTNKRLNSKIEKMQQEINNLKNTKWYDKLFGK